MNCDQCQMVSINGVACHEIGCPNANKVWRDGIWLSTHACPECGSVYDDYDDMARCCTDTESHLEQSEDGS